MNLIHKISSTLRTWVFKKKLLKFSDRYDRDPLACFYCPEMCRFSCPVAENLRHNGVTPRGKMSLLHLAERGVTADVVAGNDDHRLWYLDQCTGCGRCTEYCVYEIDVPGNLREERQKAFAAARKTTEWSPPKDLKLLKGSQVLLAEKGRGDWWRQKSELLKSMNIQQIVELDLPHVEWSRGMLNPKILEDIGNLFSEVKEIWVESPEVTWFLFRGIQKEAKAMVNGKVRCVWQALYADALQMNLGPDETFHESYHLSRLLPRYDFSVPMYDKGFMPFHSGWNVIDCGGEGHYKKFFNKEASDMALRFLEDLQKDGRTLNAIVCQSLSCKEHLQAELMALGSSIRVDYWLDRIL